MNTASATQTQPCRVLIVEDNAGDVFLIQEALRDAGLACDTTVFTDSDEIPGYIERLSAGDLPVPDLILLDLNLPKQDGADLLVTMRAVPGLARVPVIVLTSSHSPRDRERLAAAGVSRFLIKSVDLYAFLASVGQAVHEVLRETN